MIAVALFPLMIVTIIDHGSYDKKILFFVIPISFISFFAIYNLLKKMVYSDEKEKHMVRGNSSRNYKYFKSLVASYIIAIVLTAFASFLTLAFGLAEYSKFIDNSSTVIIACLTIVLIPFAVMFIE